MYMIYNVTSIHKVCFNTRVKNEGILHNSMFHLCSELQ